MSSYDSGPPAMFIIFAVLVGSCIVVGFCISCARCIDEDAYSAPPPVQIITTTTSPAPNNVYPNHVINMDNRYAPMAATPRRSENQNRSDGDTIPHAVLVPSAPTATTSDREVLLQVIPLEGRWAAAPQPPALQPLSVPAPSSSSVATSVPMMDDPVIVAFRLPYEALTTHTLVSMGGYRRVYKGAYRGETVAIKKLLPETQCDLTQITAFFHEIKLMATLEHVNIVRFVGVAWDALHELSAVTEFMEGGDLRSTLTRFRDIDHRPQGIDKQKATIALNVADALAYMHSLYPVVLHRDLKSKNILLDQNLTLAKITDFGVSRERGDNTMTAAVGTLLWMAPEVMSGERYDDKADIFSFGVVLSELDTHAMPYADVKASMVHADGRPMPDTALLQRIMTGRVSVTFSDGLRDDIKTLAQSCVAVDPYKRPSAAQVLYELQKILRAI